ncbi:MAG TPA: hypothetical protein VMH20_00730, partial [Verrucomicrobiae bacterium]|nr:hypothetical protein [Verrucomicrobiae bacterium]
NGRQSCWEWELSCGSWTVAPEKARMLSVRSIPATPTTGQLLVCSGIGEVAASIIALVADGLVCLRVLSQHPKQKDGASFSSQDEDVAV